MKRLVLAVLAALFLAPVAHAIPSLGGKGGSLTPVLNGPTVTINFGAQTRATKGAVPLTNLLKATGSPAIVAWNVTQTKGTTTYWQSMKGVGSVALSGSTVTLDELTPLAAATATLSTDLGRGYGYAINDTITLNNGAVITVSSVANSGDPHATLQNGVSGFTITTPPTSIITGDSQAVQVSTSGSGLSAQFTFKYRLQAQTPSPTTTGQNAHLGGNSTLADSDEFTVQAVGADGSLSNTSTLKINRIQDAVNVSDTGAIPGTEFGAGATSTFQAFVNDCAACDATNGDLKVLMSTGGVYANTNSAAGPGSKVPTTTSDFAWGLRLGTPYSVSFTNFNYGYAVALASGSGGPTWGPATPSITHRLVIEDACRATPGVSAIQGPDTSIPGLVPCDGSAGLPSAYDSFSLASSYASPTTTNVCTQTSATQGLTYVALEGLTLGGAPRNNAATSNPAGIVIAATCDVWIDYTSTAYAAGFDSHYQLTDSKSGPLVIAIRLQNNNNHLFINYTNCIDAAQCISDTTGNTGQAGADNHVKHSWMRRFNQNGIVGKYTPIAYEDSYFVAPEQYPLQGLHVDTFQQNDPAVGVSTLTRSYILLADGNSGEQGMFMGSGDAIGFQMDGLIQFTTSCCSLKLATGCDSTGVICLVKHVTAVRQTSQYPGGNGQNGYSSITFSSNPPDGYTLTLGVGCTPYLNFNQACSPQGSFAEQGYTVSPGTITVTFKTSPDIADPTQIQIGATAADTLQNLIAALGVSREASTCDGIVRTALSLMTNFCMDSIKSGLLTASIISAWHNDPAVYQSLLPQSSGAAHFNSGIQVEAAQNKQLNFGPGIQMGKRTQTGSVCNGTTVTWCGQMAFDSIYTDGPWQTDNVGNQLTLAQVQAQWSATYFAITNFVSGGVDPNCTLGCLQNQYNKFTGDSVSNTAEIQAEAITLAQWRAKSPKQVCDAYAAMIQPKLSGDLDVGGTHTTAIGAIGFDGNWNDGSGHAPCWDLLSGAGYETNPFPH